MLREQHIFLMAISLIHKPTCMIIATWDYKKLIKKNICIHPTVCWSCLFNSYSYIILIIIILLYYLVMDIFVYLLLLISPLNLCIALTFCTIMLVLVLYYHTFCKYSKRLKIMAIKFWIYDCIYVCMWCKWACCLFIYKWNYVSDSFLTSIYNYSLLISRNKRKICKMLPLNCTSSKNSRTSYSISKA